MTTGNRPGTAAALQPPTLNVVALSTVTETRERSGNFKEVNLGYSLKDALREAERCIQCARPTCIAGCPVQIDIPRFIRHVLVRDLDGALATICEANMFPSVCGRVCPQESQCEAHCVIAKKIDPVAIGRPPSPRPAPPSRRTRCRTTSPPTCFWSGCCTTTATR